MNLKSRYNWLIIGGGITGSALAYELQSKGEKTVLLEANSNLENATSYSYGGLPFWMGNTPEMRELCREGISLHRQLPDILEGGTEFREINLLLTIKRDESPEEMIQQYQDCEIPPQLLTPAETCELEPLLNPKVINGAIYFPDGQINPRKTNESYLKTFQRLGGTVVREKVIGFEIEKETVRGVKTTKTHYNADQTVICAGGFTRQLCHQIGVNLPVYFAHSELLETPPLDVELKGLIMPAKQNRSKLENTATTPEKEPLWEEKGRELAPAIIEPGGVQFFDRHLCLGQISRTFSDPNAEIDRRESEFWLREEIGHLFPSLKNVPAQLKRCLIAFSPQRKSFIEKVNNYQGIYVFSGFTSPLLLAPILAKKFTEAVLEA